MRPKRQTLPPKNSSFNPRTHAGCDATLHQAASLSTEFQSTHPRGVRRTECDISSRRRRFNPRTHAGCDPNNNNQNEKSKVSIHAPTRGATGEWLCQRRGTAVSIHAPTRGATFINNRTLTTLLGFNPRTHAGCDLRRLAVMAKVSAFQSTHPRGVRRSVSVNCLCKSCFNPRTHAGCDVKPLAAVGRVDVSIHAPTRGATSPPYRKRARTRCFNPRTHAGCDTQI